MSSGKTITVARYAAEQKEVWDKFVQASRNGTFLLERDYMDYHDRSEERRVGKEC